MKLGVPPVLTRRGSTQSYQQQKQIKGITFVVANGLYQEYLLDLMFIKHLPDQDYEMSMSCIDAFTKYCVIVFMKSNSESELAQGFLECMNKMGKPPKVVDTVGETGVSNSGLCHKCVKDNNLTCCHEVPSYFLPRELY